MTQALRIAILNPNATRWMTEDMVAAARRTAPAGVEVVGLTNVAGPPAIQGPEDAAACLPGLIDLYDSALREGARAIVIGCFDDTGIDLLRARGTVPVAGLGEAACREAAAAAPRFHVVTTLAVSVPVIEENIRAIGLAPRCGSVRASGVPVLDLGARKAEVQAAMDAVMAEDPEAAIVLGCAGMSPIAPELRGPAAAPLVDPVRAAVAVAVAAAVAAEAGSGSRVMLWGTFRALAPCHPEPLRRPRQP
jgi:allantoin racemase